MEAPVPEPRLPKIIVRISVDEQVVMGKVRFSFTMSSNSLRNASARVLGLAEEVRVGAGLGGPKVFGAPPTTGDLVFFSSSISARKLSKKSKSSSACRASGKILSNGRIFIPWLSLFTEAGEDVLTLGLSKDASSSSSWSFTFAVIARLQLPLCLFELQLPFHQQSPQKKGCYKKSVLHTMTTLSRLDCGLSFPSLVLKCSALLTVVLTEGFIKNFQYAVAYWEENRENFKQMLSGLMSEETLLKVTENTSALCLRFNHQKKDIPDEYNQKIILAAYEVMEKKLNRDILFDGLNSFMEVCMQPANLPPEHFPIIRFLLGVRRAPSRYLLLHCLTLNLAKRRCIPLLRLVSKRSLLC